MYAARSSVFALESTKVCSVRIKLTRFSWKAALSTACTATRVKATMNVKINISGVLEGQFATNTSLKLRVYCRNTTTITSLDRSLWKYTRNTPLLLSTRPFCYHLLSKYNWSRTVLLVTVPTAMCCKHSIVDRS